MNSFGILSDQSFRWSASYEEEILLRPTKTPSGSTRQAASPLCHPSWFSHRTLQALTQSWLVASMVCRLEVMMVAKMVENSLVLQSNVWTTAEVTDEPENLGTATEQAGVHLCASVDAGASAPPSREYRASVCVAAESYGTGLERIVDPHPRSGFGNIRCPYGGAHGLQNPGSGCFDGSGGRGGWLGSFPTG